MAPGFIDLHSHGGLVILADGRHEPKVRQGVTTEVIGVDGNGFAPFARRADLEAFVNLDAGLDGRPDLDYDWTSVATFLARFDGTVSLNIATLVGNSQLRIGVLGWDDVPADERAIDRMRALLRDAMADGAFGLSSGLDYPPGSYATTAELATLTEEAGRHGGFYHTHVRYPLGDRYLDPIREAIDIGRRASAPAHVTHFYHRDTHPGRPRAAARARRRCPRRGPRRHVRHVSVRMGRDTVAHPAATVGPGRRPGAAQGAARRPGRRATGCGPSSRRAARRTPAGPAGRTSASGPSAGRRTCAGRAGRSRTSWPRRVTTRSTSCATCCSRRTWASARSRAGRRRRRCPCSSRTRSGWSARTARSSATSRAPGRTAASRASSASSSATKPCSASRRRSAR